MRKLRGQLVENTLQLLKVHRFNQMKIESGFLGAQNIPLSAEASEGDCLNTTFCAGLCGYLITTAIGKPDIA